MALAIVLLLGLGAASMLSNGKSENSSGCKLDSHIGKSVKKQIEALLNEPHTKDEYEVAAVMLEESGFPLAAACVRSKAQEDASQ